MKLNKQFILNYILDVKRDTNLSDYMKERKIHTNEAHKMYIRVLQNKDDIIVNIENKFGYVTNFSDLFDYYVELVITKNG
jgi:hypothetical protein